MQVQKEAGSSLISVLLYALFICCVAVLWQLKVVVVEVQKIPRLVFIANNAIDTGDELLFDYNDRESCLPFLRSCPVCNDQLGDTVNKRKRPLPATDAPVPSTSSGAFNPVVMLTDIETDAETESHSA